MNENKSLRVKDTQDRSFRVQLSDELTQEIENIAKKHGCYYGDKASMSKFLAKIATKQLMIRESSPWKVAGQSDNNHLIDLHVKLPCNLNGLIFKIAKIFGDAEINICKVISNENDSYSRFTLSCPKNIDLHDLFVKIKNIKFADVIDFNNTSKTIDFLKAIGANLINTVGDNLEDKEEEKIEKIAEKYKQDQIVKDLYLVLRFRLDIENQPNKLFPILEEIAKEKISIISIKVETGINASGKQSTNRINLLIGFHPSKQDDKSISELIEFFTITMKANKKVIDAQLIDVNDDSFDE